MKKLSMKANGFLVLLIGLSLGTTPLLGRSDEFQLSSPDGKLHVRVMIQDKILYSVDYGNTKVLAPSPISMTVSEIGILGKAAKRHLLVDFHGSYKPSGLRRAYPNVLTREGVKGLENTKWSKQPTPEHNLILPFTRMLAGPLDYTPGAMINAQEKNFRSVFTRPMSLGSRCHQLALYVVFESPLQMLSDSPSHYLREKECMEFLGPVPTVWDETKVLDAKVADYILIARKSGQDWYVGALTDWTSRDLTVDFSFLGPGEYTIEIYQDGPNAGRYGNDYTKQVKNVKNSDTWQIQLAAGGGWAARIYK